jgi:hypothetical protein
MTNITTAQFHLYIFFLQNEQKSVNLNSFTNARLFFFNQNKTYLSNRYKLAEVKISQKIPEYLLISNCHAAAVLI